MGFLQNLFGSKKQQVTEPVRFPSELGSGEKLYKEYSFLKINVDSKLDYSLLHLNDELRFVQESDGIDNDSVAIYDGDKRIGYVARGIGQNMTNDFINSGNTILAQLTLIDASNKELKMDAAYYQYPKHKNSIHINKASSEDEILAPQYLKHVEESVNIINSTTNPETFFNRYSFAMQRLTQLADMDVRFSGKHPSVFLDEMKSKKQAAIQDLLKRIENKAKELKTAKGRLNYIERVCNEIDPFKDELDSESIQCLMKLREHAKEVD